MKIRSMLLVLCCLAAAACGNQIKREDIGQKSTAPASTSSPSEDRDTSPSTEAEEDESEKDEPKKGRTKKSKTEKGETEKAKDLTVDSGFTSGVNSIETLYTTAGALVTNPNDSLAAYDVTVVFNLLDADGGVMDTDSKRVPYIPAGATVPVAPLQIGFDLAEEPADLSVDIAGKFGSDEGWDGVDFLLGEGVDLEVEDAKLVTGDSRDRVEFIVTNPSEVVAERASWACVFQNGDNIVGGDSSSVSDPVVPNGKVKVDAGIRVEGVEADEVTCRAYA